MAVLAAARVIIVPRGTIKKATFPLGIGAIAWSNGIACIDSANVGAVWPGPGTNGKTLSTTVQPIGTFEGSANNSLGAATVPIGVELSRERELVYLDSVTGAGAITVANLFQMAYLVDDHTVTTVSTGASKAGLVWAVSPQGYPGGGGVEFPFSSF